ncbi:hypothetical protein [Spirochaeta cellobiosiphila]|uniref:hypothetical protein n=1 Tax=Spirochaeta cellobiosiphila TaxID=504483 RepID=UPI00041A6935|nr:hypothetical protein [Spirochaeta cellobiosiphila]
MGWSNEYLVLLEAKQEPKSFLEDFHKNLESINIKLENEDGAFIVYNESQQGEEKEVSYINNPQSVSDIIASLYLWAPLGLLSYRHSEFCFALTINYLTWDDNKLDGFVIGFNGHEAEWKIESIYKLVTQIAGLVDYKYTVGDIDRTSKTWIDLEQPLFKIIKEIETTKFTLDLRR